MNEVTNCPNHLETKLMLRVQNENIDELYDRQEKINIRLIDGVKTFENHELRLLATEKYIEQSREQVELLSHLTHTIDANVRNTGKLVTEFEKLNERVLKIEGSEGKLAINKMTNLKLTLTQITIGIIIGTCTFILGAIWSRLV